MKYIPVRLNTLRPDQPITFDLYLRIDGKFVHYIRHKDPMEKERIEKLNSKGLKKVFIQEADEKKYHEYLDQSLEDLKADEMTAKDKALRVKDTLTTQAENIERNLDTEEGYERTRGQLKKIAKYFHADPNALKNIMEASGIAGDATTHASNVASLALGIAAMAGIRKAQEFLDLGVAALVHDIASEKAGLDPTTTKDALKGDDLKRYMSHSADAVAHLAGKPFITPRVLALVADHEEVGEGRGYPERKKISQLQPLSQILNLANAFDKYCMIKKLDPKAALEPFTAEQGSLFIAEHLKILGEVVTSTAKQ